MHETTKLFKQIHEDYKELETPIEFDGFKLIGYFPYSTASIREEGLPSIPRKVFKHIENKLEEIYISDNKSVYIFEDTEKFGTENFALKLYDLHAVLGKWNQVIKY